MTVVCTYEDCGLTFDTEAEMKKHKKRDPDHFYCHRCDVDCEDDEQYFIHQLSTPSKHCVCPGCGKEFKSTSGRDHHVAHNHPAAQYIVCRACRCGFTKAASYISHFERDECRVITREMFQQKLADRSVLEEAPTECLQQRGGLASLTGSTGSADGGVSLLEDIANVPDSYEAPSSADPVPAGAFQPTRPVESSEAPGSNYPLRQAADSEDRALVDPDLVDLDNAEQEISRLSLTTPTHPIPEKQEIPEDGRSGDMDVAGFRDDPARDQLTCCQCLSRFKTRTALMTHMESAAKSCNVRNSIEYNAVVRELSAGLLGVSGMLSDGSSVKYFVPLDEGWDF